jgi:23S rRNA (uracil1939-C5)-methyltransferase
MKPRTPPKRRPARPEKHGAAPVTLEIDSLAWGGKGVGRHEGKVIFVSKAVPGDKLLVTLDKVKSRYAEGSIHAVLKASEHRVEPRCKFFSHCGGCQWLAVAYPRQLAEKELLVRSLLRRFAGEAEVEPIVPAEPFLAYRHRGDFHVVATGDTVKVGFYQEGSHSVINLDLCLLFDEAYNRRYQAIRSALKDAKDGASVSGFTLARSEEGDHYAIHLRLRHGAGPETAERLAGRMAGAEAGGLLVTEESDPARPLVRVGAPSVTFGVPGPDGRNMGLRADVRAFTQAHYALNRRLVETAASWLGLERYERLLDLYAGVGNFSAPLAAACREVAAVEQSPFAHADAKANAEALGLANIRHLPGASEDWLKKLAASSETFDAVVLDPPRAGAAGIAGWMRTLGPKRILYVSCNLPTLDRDLDALRDAGYRLERIRPFDLFPQTYGVETLCLLKPAP